MPENNKFLVRLLHDISSRQWFFFAWAFLAGLFAYLMYAYYRKAMRRNFKNPKE